MDKNVVDKGSLRREQGGVLHLPVAEAAGVVHGDPLNGLQSARAKEADFAHVADVKEANASAHGQVLGDQAATGAGILDRHIPAAKVHHFGLQRAVRGGGGHRRSLQRGYKASLRQDSSGSSVENAVPAGDREGKPGLHCRRLIAAAPARRN